MASYGDKSSTTEKRMFKVTRLTWMGITTSLMETIDAPLKSARMRLEFSKADEDPFTYKLTFVEGQQSFLD